MVVDKRGRYYAPMMMVVIYTMMVYLIVVFSVKRHQTAESAAIREARALEEVRWKSPTMAMVESIVRLGVLDHECYISPYDNLFIKTSAEFGNDWRLMSAIAYCESRFRHNAVSFGGAVGMMQLMPRTANIYDISKEELFDPEINIRLANTYYNHVAEMLAMPRDISDHDRASLILASYNGGIGRVFDAMRLARADGADPHLWSNIRGYLALLRKPEYYSRSEVRQGCFSTAYMTIRYVDDVMARYDKYLQETSHCTQHLLPISLLLEY